MSQTASLTIWQVVDGKAGHEQQSLGFIQALSRHLPVRVLKIDVRQQPIGLMDWLLKRVPSNQPAPDYVIGAGHGTHLALLAAKRATRAKAIVLMKPSLPLAWFDYALIPTHDNPPDRPNVLATQGVLNTIQPATALKAQHGVMLLGGPSKRHGWNEAGLIQQLRDILTATPTVTWHISTSRRTPESTLQAIRHITANAHVWAATETPQGWVAAQLQQAGQVWVTEDSVSMVYESLTAGGQVGLLAVPRLQQDRITHAMDSLITQQILTSFHHWQHTGKLQPAQPFYEAERAAHWFMEQEGLCAAG